MLRPHATATAPVGPFAGADRGYFFTTNAVKPCLGQCHEEPAQRGIEDFEISKPINAT